jgi:hypothetical protein
MKEFLSSIDINEIYFCDLILSDDLETGKNVSDQN